MTLSELERVVKKFERTPHQRVTFYLRSYGLQARVYKNGNTINKLFTWLELQHMQEFPDAAIQRLIYDVSG